MDQAGRILVVDDDQRIRSLLAAILRAHSYEVLSAGSGREALDIAFSSQPDLVLLDFVMPEMNGFEVLDQLKANVITRMVPVIMITALSDTPTRVLALEKGADDFLAKPFDRTELYARVKSLLKVKAYNDLMSDNQRLLEEEVNKKTRQLYAAMEKLKRSSLDTIHRLSRAAESRDNETGAHLERMSRYSAIVARRLGLGPEIVERILHASPMHDIGKIGIPDHILLKPGKLDATEWEIMKKHTVIGARILEGSQVGTIRMAETIALVHHEKWDGSGYPSGLKGKKIPLIGRIVAIADVFDALSSVRPYKKAFPLEQCFRIIEEGRGGHFDPEVVEAFMAEEKAIMRVQEAYEDVFDKTDAVGYRRLAAVSGG